jgi:hypothetical protein
MGLAYYAFHHFVSKRYKEGGFAKGAPHRVGNIVKAALAVLFTYHELKKAYQIANKSNSKLLRALVAPLNALIGQANLLQARLKNGQYSEADLRTFTDRVNAFGQQAARNGFTIKDVPIAVPGAA